MFAKATGIVGTTTSFALLQYSEHIAFICGVATMIVVVPSALLKVTQWASAIAKALNTPGARKHK